MSARVSTVRIGVVSSKYGTRVSVFAYGILLVRGATFKHPVVDEVGNRCRHDARRTTRSTITLTGASARRGHYTSDEKPCECRRHVRNDSRRPGQRVGEAGSNDLSHRWIMDRLTQEVSRHRFDGKRRRRARTRTSDETRRQQSLCDRRDVDGSSLRVATNIAPRRQVKHCCLYDNRVRWTPSQEQHQLH